MEKAIQKQPFDAVNLNWMDDLGGTYHNTGDYQRSAQIFEATLRLDSKDPNIWYYLWQDYSHLGQTAKAEQARQNMTQLISPQRPLYAKSRDPMAAIVRGQHEAYCTTPGSSISTNIYRKPKCPVSYTVIDNPMRVSNGQLPESSRMTPPAEDQESPLRSQAVRFRVRIERHGTP